MSVAVDHTTTLHADSPTSASHPAEALSLDGAALDGLVDALMACGTARGRAWVICAVLEEMSAAVAWLQTQSLTGVEVASLQRVLDAAQIHRRRMSMSQVVAGRAGVEDRG